MYKIMLDTFAGFARIQSTATKTKGNDAMQHITDNYIISNTVAHYIDVFWNNDKCDKFCEWRINTDTGEWWRVNGNHDKALPKHIQDKATQTVSA